MLHVNDFKIYLDKGIYFEGYTQTKPANFPQTSDDVEELPNGYSFRIGSYIYSVDEVTVYMWDGVNFVAQAK